MTESEATPSPAGNDNAPLRLPHLPITLFAMVMGLTGLSIAWDRSTSLWPIGSIIGLTLALLASALLLLLLLAYGLKAVKHPQQVIAELNHPIRINFFPTVSISLLLMSVYWQHYNYLSFALWLSGSLLQLLATLYIMSSWLNHSHYTSSHINPGWFIPVVGNIIVPISGVYFGYVEVSWFFFSIGLLYWLVLFTVIMNRLILHEALPPKLTPMMFILLAPPSIGFVSYTLLSEQIDVFARILYYSALFIALLLAANLPRFWKLPFFVSSWAFSFPLAALTMASLRFAHLTAHQGIQLFAQILLLLLSVLVLWLVGQTLKAVKDQRICLPE